MIEQQQEIISLLTTMVTQNATKAAVESSTPVAPSLPVAPPPTNISQQETSSLEELLDLTSDDEFIGSPSWSSMLTTSISHGSQPSHPVPEFQLTTPVSQPVLQLSAPVSLSASQLNTSILQSALQHSTTPVPQSTSLAPTPVVQPPVQFSTQPQPLLTAVSQFSTPLPQLDHLGAVQNLQTSSSLQCSIVPAVSQPTFQSTPVAQTPVQFSSPQLTPASQISTPLPRPADLGTVQTQALVPQPTFNTPPKLIPVERVMMDNPGCDVASLRRLTTALAREAIFGKEALRKSSLSGKNQTGCLEKHKLDYIKAVVKSRVPNMPEVQFEGIWSKCRGSLSKSCQTLRVSAKKKLLG